LNIVMIMIAIATRITTPTLSSAQDTIVGRFMRVSPQ